MSLKLNILTETFAICKIPPSHSIPKWALDANFCSVAKTPDEISIVCPQDKIKKEKEMELDKDWRALQIEGFLDFSLVGILAKIALILKARNIFIFVISTFNTDYILVKNYNLEKAILALEKNGISVKSN